MKNLYIFYFVFVLNSMQRLMGPLSFALMSNGHKISATRFWEVLPFRWRRTFIYCEHKDATLMKKLSTRLLFQGKPQGTLLMQHLALFVKDELIVDPYQFLYEQFFIREILPFKLYSVRFSNRNYLFPGPVPDLEATQLTLKLLRRMTVKQKEFSLLDRWIHELMYFFMRSSNSFLSQYCDHLVDQGFENRAFIHYRWFLKR